MKITKVFLLLVIVLSLLCINVFADGELYEFNLNGFDYVFGYGAIMDEYPVSDNSVLYIKGYNGSRFVDITSLSNGIPNGLYIRDIMAVSELDSYNNWEVHKDEYLQIDMSFTNNFLYFYDPNVTVKVKAENNTGVNEFISFPDQAPIIANERTLLPIRAIAEHYGWSVDWKAETKCVTIENESVKIEITIGDNLMRVIPVEGLKNGISLDVPACILNGRTMLPVRAVAEAMGVTVDWNQEEQCVILK